MFEIFKNLKWFFKLKRKTYAIAVLCLFIVAIATAITPMLIGNIIDEMTANTLTERGLILQIGTILFLAILMYALRYVWRALIFTNSTHLEAIMRNRLFDHFTKMDSQFFHEHRTGNLMAHATNDLAALKFVAGGGILTLADSVAVGGTTLFSMMFIIDWRLTLLTIIPFPLLIVVARKLGGVINRRYRKSLESFSRMNNRVQESVAGMRVIKAFGEEESDYQNFEDDTEDVVQINKSVNQVDAMYAPSIEMITQSAYVLTLFVGTFFVGVGEISIGDLVAYFSYLSMMAWPLLAVGRLANTLERGNVSYTRIEELLAIESHITEADEPIDKELGGDIDFDVKSFTYENDEDAMLKDVQFTLKSGETLGLVGKTGSGKSTIFKLLMREYDSYDGTIKYNGHDIKDYATDTVAEGIGYVSQEPFLFSHSILENIRFGAPETPKEQVEEYAKLADVYEDIMDTPEQFETQVGEKGVALSGGQKQRISIARALTVDPEFLFLDDSLSAVDAHTENQILNNFKELRKDRSTIIAAHRISSIIHADLILVMDEGRVIGKGNHQELLQSNEWYRSMYEKQQLQTLVEEGGAVDE